METGKNVYGALGTMQIIEGKTEFQIPEQTAAAIGKFDGIHKGHRLLVDRLLEQKKKGLKSAIFTFDIAPEILLGKEERKELLTRAEKREKFAAMGMDYLIEFPLNQQTAATLPEFFVREILAGKMQIRYLAAGTDVSFGHKGMGDYRLLERLSAECGYQVEIVDKICYEDREISSTYVREAVTEGKMELTRELLGNPYSIIGVVSPGRQLGRTIDMPTANLYPEENKLLPPNGVYFSEIRIEDKWYKGVTNVGNKPTVGDKNQMGVETFLFDTHEDLYGKKMEVFLLKWKRAEKKFASVEALAAQMKQDREDARSFFSER